MPNTKKYLHKFNSGFSRIKPHVNCFVHRYWIKSFPRNLCSRSSKNSLSVSKLETQSSKLGSRTLKIETWNSSLKTRFSILENFEDQESSFASRLSTYIWTVLYILWSCYCLCANKGQACCGQLDMAPRGVWEIHDFDYFKITFWIFSAEMKLS